MHCQRYLRCSNRDPIHPNINAVTESPCLFLRSQSESAVLDLVKLNERLKELGIGLGVPKVMTEEASELHEAVQTASSDHVKQFSGRERDGYRHNSARTMVQQTDQPCTSKHRLAYVAKNEHRPLTEYLRKVTYTPTVDS